MDHTETINPKAKASAVRAEAAAAPEGITAQARQPADLHLLPAGNQAVKGQDGPHGAIKPHRQVQAEQRQRQPLMASQPQAS